MITSSLLHLAISLLGQSELAELDYRIHPIPAEDRTRIEVALRFNIKPNEEVTIELPRDYYGSPALDQFVDTFTGVEGTRVGPGKASNVRIATANSRGLVNIKYGLSYDPAKLANATFSPNVSANHFHLAGCQWMLRIGALDVQRRHRISITKPPLGWKFYSSLAADPVSMDVKSSYSDLVTSSLGGTNRGFYDFRIRGKRVTVSIPDSLDIPDAKVVESVRKIIDLQRRWFKDDRDDFFHVAVNPKPDNIAGTCIRRHFVCFLKKDVTLDQLNNLLAHEMFHNWLGNQIVVRVPVGAFPLRHQWFTEGVNEYFARKLLLEAGLITRERLAQLVNADLLNIRDNPNRNASLSDLAKAADEGRFDTTFTKLSYYRGALMALRWDRDLRANGKPESSKFLLRLFEDSNQGQNPISEDAFFRTAGQFGIPLSEQFEKHIVRGETITLDSDSLGPEFEGRIVSLPSYDVGFDLAGSRSTRLVKGVRSGSRAFAAGLRDGMTYIASGNTNRFGNSWDPSKPIRLVVEEHGKERVIEYFPHGPAEPVTQFVRKRA